MVARTILGILMFLAILPVYAGPVAVWTEHGDNARTGANTNETILAPSKMSQSQFGKLFTYTLDDQSYSQPLYIPNVTIAVDGRVHNVVYVSTVNNSVYAFDADSNAANGGNPLWKVNLTPVGARPPTASDMSALGACGGHYADISGNMGIIGTPVIDPSTNTLYVVARTVENGAFVQRLHALDITSGAEKFGGPVVIQAVYNGITFDPVIQNQRTALALVNGVVYIGWSSHCDFGAYHGWLMGYNASNLSQVALWTTTTSSGSQAAIWQSGQAVTADSPASGTPNIYLLTGNGTWDGMANFGESFVKLATNTTGAVREVDYFTPSNWSTLNGGDIDLGAAGAMGIPGTTLIMGGGKQGKLYLLDTGNLGKEHATDMVVQEFQAVFPSNGADAEIHGSTVYYNSGSGQYVYVWGDNDFLRAYQFTNGAAANQGSFNSTAVAASTMPAPRSGSGTPGGFLTVSSNGSSNGIVWALTPYSGGANSNVVSGILYAFDAVNFTGTGTTKTLTELWDSKQNAARDDVGNYAKFTYPTVSNGKVYVVSWGNAASGAGQLCVYGLLNSVVPPPPMNVTASPGNGQVTLKWSASTGATSYNIFRGTSSGGESTTPIATGISATTYTATGLVNGTTYYFKVAAVDVAGTSALSAEVSAKPSNAITTTITLTPVADSYVRDGTYANTNFGTAVTLYTKTDGSGFNRNTFLKFDLSKITGTVQSAQLRLYGSFTSADTGTLGVYSVAVSSWTETGITWNNQPLISASPLYRLAVSNSTPQYVSLDVTGYVKINAGSLISLALHMASTPNQQPYAVNSRESTSNKPQLVVTTVS